jgi:hypothetical protein
MKGLTREQTKGTLTFHLPLQRGPETPPEMTIIVRRIMADRWHAGIAVCSIGDTFEKRYGRKLAFHRLSGNPFMADSPEELLGAIETHLNHLSHNRPYTLSVATIQELPMLTQPLAKMRVE